MPVSWPKHNISTNNLEKRRSATVIIEHCKGWGSERPRPTVCAHQQIQIQDQLALMEHSATEINIGPKKVKLGNFHYWEAEVKSGLVLKNLSGIYFTFPLNGDEAKWRESNCCSHMDMENKSHIWDWGKILAKYVVQCGCNLFSEFFCCSDSKEETKQNYVRPSAEKDLQPYLSGWWKYLLFIPCTSLHTAPIPSTKGKACVSYFLA